MKKLNIEKIADLWAVGLSVLGGVSLYSVYKYGKTAGTYKGMVVMKDMFEEELRKIAKKH